MLPSNRQSAIQEIARSILSTARAPVLNKDGSVARAPVLNKDGSVNRPALRAKLASLAFSAFATREMDRPAVTGYRKDKGWHPQRKASPGRHSGARKEKD